MWTPHYSIKQTDFCGPARPWTVQTSVDNADAGSLFAHDCPTALIDSPTGHYTITGAHSSSL